MTHIPLARIRFIYMLLRVVSALLLLTAIELFTSVGHYASAEMFNYNGYLESDSLRSATMNLSISGQNVTGYLSLPSVCQSNARLPGAEFNLTGSVNGQWEGSGAISGTWTGAVLWCGQREERSGSFNISSGQSIIFRGNGSYYNNYIFTPTGKTSAAPPPPSSSTSGTGIKGDVPTTAYGSPSYSSLAPPTSGMGILPHMKESIFGVIQMSLNETRLFSLPLGGTWYRKEDMKRIESFSDCYDATYFTEPGSMLTSLGTIGDGINVKAIGEGIGKVWGSKGCSNCSFEGGGRGRCNPMGIWVVVVGEKGLKEYEELTGTKKSKPLDPGPKPDIEKASLRGRVVMVGTKKPVASAQISLYSGEGGTYYRDNWKSNQRGDFNIRADNMLVSGVYEVMAQWHTEDMGTAEDPFTVYKDLWPIKKYFITITRDTAKKGNLNVGDIEMDTVDNIFNKGNGRESSENRDPLNKTGPPATQSQAASQPPPGYSPIGDPNLKNQPSGKMIDAPSLDKLGSDFQDGSGKTKKPAQSTQTPHSQPESYSGSVKSKDTSIAQTPPPAGYPPGYSPPAYPQKPGYPQDSRSSHNYSSTGRTTGSSYQCDESEKKSAYRTGFDCGKKARKYKNTMTQNCSSILTTYKNMDAKSGWGDCLAGAFNEGYLEGAAQIGPEQPKTTSKITAELENRAGDNIHIFVEGQDTFGPQNKLTPGQKRTIPLNISAGQSVKFAAGRNGQVLARCSWTAGAAAYVKFSGSNSLTCTTK